MITMYIFLFLVNLACGIYKHSLFSIFVAGYLMGVIFHKLDWLV